MTQSNGRRAKQLDEIMKAVEFVMERHFGYNKPYYDNIKDKALSDFREEIDSALPGKKPMSAETADLLGMNDPALNAKLKAESDMIDRAERAMKKTPNWNAEPWKNYHKVLVKVEERTGFTIEQFMKWWNSDDFRKQQNIWLKPSKIDEFWVTAMSETDTSPEEETEFQKATEWTPAPRRE